MRHTLLLSVFVLTALTLNAQKTRIIGSVIDAQSFKGIGDVLVTIELTGFSTLTNDFGAFEFTENLPLGEQIIVISKAGYIRKRYPIVIENGAIIDIADMLLEKDILESADVFTITLSDDELNDDNDGADNISGLLASSLDVFQRTAAFDFSPSFFRVRGLDSNNGSILINGIEMNKQFNGRPQWSNWGGINDVLRNQELTMGLSPSTFTFGGVLGATNIDVRPSQMKSGGRITYSSSNRSYNNRFMATYASGLLKNDWAFTLSLGRRWGNEGCQDATSYKSNSIFIAAEKKLANNHSFSLAGIYTPNSRGKSSPNTQEVYDLKDLKYNEYWGWQNGEKRNSRIKTVDEPILILNHNWNINSKTSLSTSLGYQFGHMANSRLDYNGTDLVNGFPQGGGANPSPTYYQKLPSYYVRNYPNNLEYAYLALKSFQKDGQIKWEDMYAANISNVQNDKNATYILYEDRVDDNQLSFNSILRTSLSAHALFTAGINYRALKSENYARVRDLLGGSGYLDIDNFAATRDEAQNDLLNPNRIVTKGDAFKYHYNIFSKHFGGFAQSQFSYNKIDVFAAFNFNYTSYQREGLYKNGGFPNNSFGKGDTFDFLGIGVKAGFTYKLSGKHIFALNLGSISRAPTLQNTFTNSRENHNVVPDISEEHIFSTDLSYVFRSPYVKSKLSGYYISINNASEISFYFADGVGGDNAIFVQEILQDISKEHFGIEWGIEGQLTNTLKIKAVASFGQFTYANNPNLFLSTEPTIDAEAAGFIDGFKDYGKTSLKHYKLASGPQGAFSVGFEYRDPNYWWFGASANFFTNTYVDVSPLTRSSNFNTDSDGNVFNDYDEDLARELLTQEQFDNYMVINLLGGKSWKISKYYLGLFVSVNNLLNQDYKSGGFEQGRNANYRELRDDKALENPVFGPKYWYGRGTSYFLNINLRF